jgi:hypothetical protein
VCRESGHLAVCWRADLLLVADRVSQFLAVSAEILQMSYNLRSYTAPTV